MATFYVDGVGGNDGNDGSTGSPWATLIYAESQIASTDIVKVRTATYVERLVISKPCTFEADAAASPVIDGEWDGTFPVPSGGVLPGGDHYDGSKTGVYSPLVLIQANNVTFKGFEVKRSSGRGIGSDTVANAIVEDCTTHNHYNAGLHFENCTDHLAENCTVHTVGLQRLDPDNPTGGNWPVSLNQVSCTDGLVNNCTVHSTQGEGISIGRFSLRTKVTNTTSYNNRALQIYIQNADDSTIDSCLVFCTSDATYGYVPGIVVANEWGTSGDPGETQTITNNIVINCRDLISFWKQGKGALINSVIAHNTLINAKTNTSDGKTGEIFSIQTPAGVYAHSGTVIHSNICLQTITANGESYEDIGTTTGLTFSYNGFDTTPPANIQGTGDVYTLNLADLNNAGTGDIGTSLAVAADYIHAVSGDAIDVGNTSSTVLEDYLGNTRDATPDMGAYEDGSAPPAYTATAAFTGTPLSGNSPLSVTFTSTASTDDPSGYTTVWEKKETAGVYTQFSTVQDPVEELTTGTWSIKQTISTPGGAGDVLERVDYVVVTATPPATTGPQIVKGWWQNPWFPEGWWLTDWWLEFGADAVPPAPLTIPSHEQSTELSILAFDPLIVGSTLITDQLGSQVESYQHTITAIGGYESAKITIKDRQLNVEDWLDRGLGRHIEVYNPALVKIWEGAVNQVTVNLGGLSVTRGPLLEIGNKVALTYSAIDTSVSPPAVGTRITSDFSEDTDSQAKYGELTTILSTGGIAGSEIDAIRDTFLAENKEPKTSQILTIGGGGDISLSLDCVGYYHFLKRYTYSQVAVSGDDDLDDVMIAILAAEPNSIISTSTTNIAENTLQVKQYIDGNSNAWKLIQGLVARGDTSDNRYIFQVLSDRVATYAAVPTTVEYQQRLSDPAQRIETLAGIEVRPWDVKAAKWLFVPDFLIGKAQPSDLRLDPRMVFIESVTYTKPWGLTIQGGSTDKLSQKLAKLGLGGIGAGTS